MTTDLCTEDVVVCISSPQMVTSEAGGERSAAAGAAGGAPRVQASSAAVELGRRLLLAARAGHTALVMDLMAKGAPFTTDWLGTSPLHVAAGNAHAATCAVLLRAGVSRDSRTKVDRTPLHLAAYGGHARTVQLLLEHGAAVDCRDLLRMTPLHWAAQRGHAAAAGALLRRGADPAALSKFHKTPRDLAADPAVRALIDDALRQRARSPPAPPSPSPSPSPSERLTGPQETIEQPNPPTFRTIHRIQEVKNKPKQGKFTKIDSKVGASGAAAAGAEEDGAQLLRRHGITLLPADDGSTVLSALQAGRTVVLSDAGKLMLKENVSPPPTTTSTGNVTIPTGGVVTPTSGVTSLTPGVVTTTSGVTTPPASSSTPSAGVVLTATPVSSPPKPGVKIFTINNKLLTVPKDPQRLPVKKIIKPQDVQVKFVQLPADAKILSPKKSVQMKAKAKLASTPRPPVKIIMNKSNYSKLIASAKTNASNADSGGVHMVCEAARAEAEAGASYEREVLRAELRAARLTIASLSAELAACRARLAISQPAPQ